MPAGHTTAARPDSVPPAAFRYNAANRTRAGRGPPAGFRMQTAPTLAIVTRSERMRLILSRVETIARSDTSVLLRLVVSL
jgi:hypothetical protein